MKSDRPEPEASSNLPAGVDLITDAELDLASDDEFQAQHLVAELAAVIDGHEPGKSANIALYGPWGSGKSSIARLLENEYDQGNPQQLRRGPGPQSGTTAFVRFDAFKYAGHSLRRNFLLQVAQGLDQKEGMDERLYSSVTSRRVRLTWWSAWTAAWQIFVFIVVPTIVAALLGAMVWAGLFSDLALGTGTKEVFPETLTLLSVPAAAGLFALMREVLPSTVTTSSPSSEEQFEEQFSRLVTQSGHGRVVIFVDEIDRCAPSEVVETLDTIRTFLDVKGCVVIVAADQRVLERALSEKVRQTTPDDTTNPYYSSGSAYLDKVFHYQFSIPPLLPTVISKYALKLTEGKGGVWRAVDRENVISVLIPTHVRSPRRVKALLNNFVLTYRLALDRNVSATGRRTLSERATELAVLVCLRSEFPLFAHDLPQFPALPKLVRWLTSEGLNGVEETAEDNAPTTTESSAAAVKPKATDAAWKQARSYHEGKTPADTPFSSVEVGHRSPTEPNAGQNRVVEAIRDDLVGYLSKTAYVDSPATDLIYLIDSQGFYGLEADVAEQLASFSLNAERRQLGEAISELDGDAQTSALRFLAHRTRESAFGEDGSNMASSLLLAVTRASETAVSSTVNEVATAIEQQQERNRLRRSDLGGALVVGLQSSRPEAADLVRAVMASAEYETDADLSLQITRHAQVIAERHPDETYRAMGWAMIHDHEGFTSEILRLELNEAIELVRAASPSIALTVNEAANPSTAPPPDVEILQPDNVKDSAGDALDRLLAESHRALGEFVCASFIGDAGAAPTTHLVIDRLDQIGCAETRELAEAARNAAIERPWQELAYWIAIASGDRLQVEEKLDTSQLLVEKLWSERSGETVDSDEFGASLDAVRAMSDDVVVDRIQMTRSLLDDEVVATSSDEATVRNLDSEYRRIEHFVDADLLDAATVGDRFSRTMAEVLSHAPPVVRTGPVSSTEVQQQWVDDWAAWIADRAAASNSEALVDAITSSEWLPAPRRELIALRTALAAGLPCPLTLDRMIELSEQHASDPRLAELLKEWATKYAVEPSEIYALAEPHLPGELPEYVRDAISAWADGASRSQRTSAAIPVLSVLPSQRPSSSYLVAVGASRAKDGQLADKIVHQCQSRSGRRWNPERRKNVLETWRIISPQDSKARLALLDAIAIGFINQAGYTAAIELLEYSDLLVNPPAGIRDDLRQAFHGSTDGKPRASAVRTMLDTTGIEKKSLIEKAARRILGKR